MRSAQHLGWFVVLVGALALGGCSTPDYQYEMAHRTEVVITTYNNSNNTKTEYDLGCDPVRGDHPQGEAACAQIWYMSHALVTAQCRDQAPGSRPSGRITGMIKGDPIDLTLTPSTENKCDTQIWEELTYVFSR